jgi:citronellol/citronellal dehydrogenase
MSLKGQTLFITGGSRGIGLAIALRAARDGANVVIAAKTSDPHPKLPGTIHSVVNHTREVTVSLHVYGFNINLTQRAQFDVEQGMERPITLRMTPAH